MPWTATSFRKHWKGATQGQLERAARIANAVLKDTGDEGKAIRIGIYQAKKKK